MKKKIIYTALLSACLCTLPAYAAFDVNNDSVALSKTGGTEYSLSVSGTENSDGAMLVVYGDVKGSIDETISLNPNGTFNDYYIYYSRYFSKASNSMDINVKVDLSEEVLGGNIYAALISYDGTITHLNDVVMPGVKSIKSLKLLLPDGTEAQSEFKVSAGNAYAFSAKAQDAYDNSFNVANLSYTLSGCDAPSIAMDKNALIIDKKSDAYGKKFTVTVQLGDLSDSVDVSVSEEDSDTGGGSSGGSGGGGSKTSGKTGGTITVDSSLATDSADSVFDDLSKDFWAYDSIISLYKKGIVQGSGKNVNPNGLITREEICALITRSCGLKPESSQTEKLAADTTISPWALEYVSAAVEAKVMNGDSAGIIHGTSNATRQEAFSIIARAFNIAESDANAEFEDIDSVADWAKGYINAMYAQNIVKGTEGYIRPDDSITRAEFFAVLDRILK